ncbi:hypothetical protein SYJ56_14275 [Algoriphagus sp. D3-2-R+10]|uniref:hypothetical protein n=1 Tax=Algoriphagus aurantiacus TaxID=3103948 RepID=UPI002B38B920|nr:hypothetical protein [Algoriphagus sp. D3-2-R+10]MEB2776485.1 hypothetical protein [Algoriphagus sp. D3-2-R+10]
MKAFNFLAFLAVLAFCLQSCNDLDHDIPEFNELLLSCQTSDPINELQWLTTLAEKY